MSTKKDFFSVVIPNWNGQKFLATCLNSLKEQSYQEFEIILVDNGSTDDSVPFLERNYREVKIIQEKTNVGFAGAVNDGIGKASGELILLLNNDTELDKNFLKKMLEATKEFPKYSLFAAKMLDFKDRNIIDTCGDKMTWSGRSYKFGELERDSQKFDKPYPIFGACAGAAVYRRELFQKIGLFDTDFFAYLEDVDLDFRAQLAGFKCLFVPDAKVFHIGSATAGKRSAFAFELMIKNHWHLIFKNFPLIRLLTSSPKIIYSDLRFLAAAIRYNFLYAYFKGLWRALAESPKMIRKRIRIQKNRQVDVAYLDSIIEPKFNYKNIKEALYGRK